MNWWISFAFGCSATWAVALAWLLLRSYRREERLREALAETSALLDAASEEQT